MLKSSIIGVTVAISILFPAVPEPVQEHASAERKPTVAVNETKQVTEQPKPQVKPEPPKPEPKPVTWRDNPQKCDQNKQWIAKEPPHKCINKPRSVGAVATQSKPVSAPSGDKYTWLRAAGIPESEWPAVDYIVTRESSWNPLAVNASSGACSLVQALPCSKIPGDWRDPVNALKWQKQYVEARYGGYWGAYNFWKVNHWY